jgi:hypothetical protein
MKFIKVPHEVAWRKHFAHFVLSILDFVRQQSTVGMDTLALEHMEDVHELPDLQYQHLDYDRIEIRLFSLGAAGLSKTTIQGNLEVFSLEECPPFRALSYEWGTKEKMNAVVIKGSRLDIRANLLAFLQLYRDRLVSATDGNEAYLWADQLCIDQQNDFERNQQVSLMGRIFSRAGEVIAWLGPGFAASLHELQSYEFGSDFSNEHLPKLPPPLISLLKATYWQRLWVQQEIALAKDLILASESTWMPFASIADVMSDVRVYFWHVLTRDAPALFWHITPRYENAVESYTLYDAVGFYASKLCEDPRDKVYGLLGMVSGKSQENIVVDYRLSVREVYAMAVQALSTDARIKRGEDGSLDLDSCRELGELMELSGQDITSVIRDMYVRTE